MLLIPDKIKEKLSGMNILVEDWGGKVQSQDISALKRNWSGRIARKNYVEASYLN